MHSDLTALGWTEEHWNRIQAVVSEEAQKARIAAQVLDVVGPLDPATVAVPNYGLSAGPPGPMPWSAKRLTVDSNPTLQLTKIAVNVYLHSREAADPELNAALTMFRRAANYVARIEDALVFNGQQAAGGIALGLTGIPAVYQVTPAAVSSPGLLVPPPPPAAPGAVAVPGAVATPPFYIRVASMLPGAPRPSLGDQVITAIIKAINDLDTAGQLGPYACVLSPSLFEAICTPNAALILPRDRILPFLQGPLLRASVIQQNYGVVLALSGSPLELVVGHDIGVKYLQTNEEPRLVFQVSERVALRIKEPAAIATLH